MPDHGGSLERAARLFPDAPKPFVDLSTGINPHSYPVSGLPATAFARLPEPGREAELRTLAAECYGAPSAANLAAAPGTQILLPQVAALVPPGVARILGPTYAEHARAAALAGHRVEQVARPEALVGADLAILVNPNNPDGRLLGREALLPLAGRIAEKGGLTVVDEAFMDVVEPDESLAGDVEGRDLVVLRSFGKFYGLAGLRLGFAVASVACAGDLRARLGPWAVSGPALDVGIRALGDRDWRSAMRARLAREAARLDGLLRAAVLEPAGGTSLYRFVTTAHAPGLFEVMGRHGIVLRNFAERADVLRIGLPGEEGEWERLERALADWSGAKPVASQETRIR